MPRFSIVPNGRRTKGQDMRAVFGVLGLLLVLSVVGFVARNQLRSLRAPAAVPVDAASSGILAPMSGTPAQQSQQLQDKVRDDLNKVMQQAPARLEPAQ
jgi:hypothetical protein